MMGNNWVKSVVQTKSEVVLFPYRTEIELVLKERVQMTKIPLLLPLLLHIQAQKTQNKKLQSKFYYNYLLCIAI